MKFKFDILENSESGIIENGCKEIYNLDSDVISLNSFIKEFGNVEKSQKIIPHLSSSLIVSDKIKTKALHDIISVIVHDSNNIGASANSVYLINGFPTNNLGCSSITPKNFRNATVGFCARRLIESTPFNCKDEYMKPSDQILQSKEYKQWSNDCVIYSLFENQSFQSSLRAVEYQNKKWDIVNEFFWQDINILKELAENHNFIEMIDDFDNHDKQRFVYQEIEKIKNEPITFSQDALNLLEFANELIVKSFPFRKMMHDQKEEYHLNSWDCGYAQLKLVWKEFLKDDFKIFDELRKKLADKLRPKVYEFGFLFE